MLVVGKERETKVDLRETKNVGFNAAKLMVLDGLGFRIKGAEREQVAHDE